MHGVHNESCALLKFSPELRNKIYRLVLLSEPDVSIDGQHLRRPKPLFTVPPLLRSCRKIAQEASAMWYGGTIFYYERTAVLSAWLHMLGVKKCKLLRKIRCTQHCRHIDSAEWYLVQVRDRLKEECLIRKQIIRLRCRLLTKDGKIFKQYTRTPAITAANAAEHDRETLKKSQELRDSDT